MFGVDQKSKMTATAKNANFKTGPFGEMPQKIAQYRTWIIIE